MREETFSNSRKGWKDSNENQNLVNGRNQANVLRWFDGLKTMLPSWTSRKEGNGEGSLEADFSCKESGSWVDMDVLEIIQTLIVLMVGFVNLT